MHKAEILSVGVEVLTAVVMKGTVFWDITPFSPLKVNRQFGGTCGLHLQGGIRKDTNVSPAFTLVSCTAYSTLKMEAICSETSVDLQTDYTALYHSRQYSSRSCLAVDLHVSAQELMDRFQ
jgi:hypothetical protein